ncbi:MAG: ribokinase [Pirellulales bacterium]|nr:ribokinase [Pirellulales bacterium]
MAAPAVLVLGSINTDLVLRGARLPRPGETVLGGQFYQAGGGKGANQAVAAARAAREPVLFIAAVGDDLFGRESLARLAQENLDCRLIKTVPSQPSGVALILVDAEGQNMIGVASGANLNLVPADVDRVPDEVFRSARVLLASLESPLDTVAHGLARARQAGLLTVLNPAPAAREILDMNLLRQVDVLTPNEVEAATLSGIEFVDEQGIDAAQALAAARKLQALGCRAVIITLGAEGVLVVEDDPLRIPAAQVRAIDATAAGDAFSGALCVALSEGRTLVEAAHWATRAAALSVSRAGAQPSLATRDEIEQFSP